MAKVLMLSKTYMQGHPWGGSATFFAHKFLRGLGVDYSSEAYRAAFIEMNHNQQPQVRAQFYNQYFRDYVDYTKLSTPKYKYHTIRAGNRFKPGDLFSPRVWAGKPYSSPQMVIWWDIPVVSVWDYEVKDTLHGLTHFLNGGWINNDGIALKEVAENDGLELLRFKQWFNEPMKGQIICWNNRIKY